MKYRGKTYAIKSIHPYFNRTDSRTRRPRGNSFSNLFRGNEPENNVKTASKNSDDKLKTSEKGDDEKGKDKEKEFKHDGKYFYDQTLNLLSYTFSIIFFLFLFLKYLYRN